MVAVPQPGERGEALLRLLVEIVTDPDLCPVCHLAEAGGGECPQVLEEQRWSVEPVRRGDADCPCCDDCRARCRG